MTAELKHHLEVSRVPSRCEVPGHTDLKITCSCGYEQTLLHGARPDVETAILYHRLTAVEKAIGIDLKVTWQPRS